MCYHLSATLADAIAGLAQVAFPDATSGGVAYDLNGTASAAVSHTYTFIFVDTFGASVVITTTDRATNVAVHTFTVERDATPPQVWVNAPAGVISGVFTVTWGAVDAQAGVAWYDLDVSVDGGPWQRVLTHTPITNYQHTNPPNTHVTFRVTATDHASNSAVSGTYAETAAGRTYTFPARNVRYVRDYLNGSNKNAGNHWVEIEVWGFRTTVYVGAHYEKDITGNTATSYYTVGGRRIAMRMRTNSTNVVYYLHTDHLGSASLTTDASGNRVGELRYKPYGETRYIWGVMRTDRRFTGQRWEAGVGLYDYGARYYDPLLGRFISADTIVPGAAASVGGGAATLGYSEQTRLTPLTVGFHETRFLDILNTENGELLQFGPPALWDRRVRQEHTVPMGPANPQALNRYAYCLGNPVRYVDPTGHDSGGNRNVGYDYLLDPEGNVVRDVTTGDPIYRIWYFGHEMYVRGDSPALRDFMRYADEYKQAQSAEILATVEFAGGILSTGAGIVVLVVSPGSGPLAPVAVGAGIVATVGGALTAISAGITAWSAGEDRVRAQSNAYDKYMEIYDSGYNVTWIYKHYYPYQHSNRILSIVDPKNTGR